MTIGLFTPLYSFAFFLPTIVKDLGYTNETAQLMSVPPYVVACFFTIIGSYFADKAGQRGIFMLGFELVAIIGFLMLVSAGKPHIQYAGTFFAASGMTIPMNSLLYLLILYTGIYPLVPLIGAWTSNNIGGSMKRGVGIAMQVGFGNLGGVIAGFVYLSKDAPRYFFVLFSQNPTYFFILTISFFQIHPRPLHSYWHDHNVNLPNMLHDRVLSSRKRPPRRLFHRRLERFTNRTRERERRSCNLLQIHRLDSSRSLLNASKSGIPKGCTFFSNGGWM